MPRLRSYVGTLVRSMAIALLLSSLACKSKKEESVVSKDSGTQFELGSTLVERLPSDTLGFAYVDLEHDAYKKLLASPWGKSGNEWLALSKKDAGFTEIENTLAEFGLDLQKPETFSTLMSEAAVFVSLVDKEVPLGVLFRAPSEESLTSFVSKLKTQLEAKGKEVEELTAEGTNGLKMTLLLPQEPASQAVAAEPKEVEIYLLHKADIGVVSFNQALGSKALAASNELPAVTKTPAYAAATKGLGSEKASYAFGYFDLKQLASVLDEHMKEVEQDPAAREALGNFQSLAWAASMVDTPEQEIRLQLAEKGAKILSELQLAKGDELARFLPAAPMAILTLDAGMLKPIVTTMEQSGEAQVNIDQAAPWLKDVKKLGLAVSVAQPGGMLPVPNISISVQAKESQQLVEMLKAMLQGMIVASGMAPNAEWQSAEKGGVPVHSIMGPMGLSLNLAAKDGVVLLSNNAAELEGVLSGSSAKPSKLVMNTLSPERFLTLNLDFEQVSKFMQTMGGVLSLYAPQDEATRSLLSEESISQVANLGRLAVVVEKRDNTIVMASKYHEK